MHPRASTRIAVIAAVVVSGYLAACGGAEGSATTTSTTTAPVPAVGPAAAAPTTVAPGQPSAALALEEGRTAIDVRAPDEYAAGHVQGAENINVEDPSFDQAVAGLDPDGTYVVYCRSGRRSAIAASRMQAAGLDVVDGGALDDMTAAGWPTA